MDSGIEWNCDIASESGDVRPLPVPVGISLSVARKLATIEFPYCMLLLQEATIRLRGCWDWHVSIEAGVGAGAFFMRVSGDQGPARKQE
ncbi:hypothetical protein YC2023_099651 [Brassica napus]